MKLVFVRNVKFSAAECNSFNMRKKNIGDLASKKFSEGSNAKKQPLGCKVASFGVHSNTHHGAKLHLLECKVTPIMVQSNNYQNVIPNLFSFNLAYFPTTNAPLPIKSQPSQNCIIIQFECIFMQFWAILSISIVKLKYVFYTLFYIYSVK